mgnify:CR=1 FL=1
METNNLSPNEVTDYVMIALVRKILWHSMQNDYLQTKICNYYTYIAKIEHWTILEKDNYNIKKRNIKIKPHLEITEISLHI